jgi:mycothiol synthase
LSGDSGVIEFLSVKEGFRGRGLGRHLLRHEINLATRNGLTSIHLSVNGENDLALGLYLSEGFKLEKTVVCYSRNA